MQISRGVIVGAQKIVIYGPEGIGKSSFAAKFPNAVFIDTEGSTKHMDVARLPKPTSWTMLIEEVKYVKQNPHICDTLVIDTADWAEQLCKNEVCAKAQKKGIEDFGYGKGYVYVAEEFGRLLNLLEDLIELGINIVLVAHAQMRKFEQPDELGAYDRWEMKLEKKVAPLVKEWADMVLFANYKTIVVNVDGQGADKGVNKAQGGKRVMYTTHHPCWDAKNRHDLLDELLLDYDEIKHCIWTRGKKVATPPPQQPQAPQQTPPPQQEVTFVDSTPADWSDVGTVCKTEKEVQQVLDSRRGPTPPPPEDYSKVAEVSKPLADLMQANDVTVKEIQEAVGRRGYYPVDTSIDKYDPKFIQGVLVGAWPQVFKMIQDNRNDNPF